MSLIYEKNYAKLTTLLNLEELREKGFLKLKSPELMDLNADFLRKEKNGNIIIALAHDYTQNGDVITDPDMEIRILPKMKMAEALTFQQRLFNIFKKKEPPGGFILKDRNAP